MSLYTKSSARRLKQKSSQMALTSSPYLGQDRPETLLLAEFKLKTEAASSGGRAFNHSV